MVEYGDGICTQPSYERSEGLASRNGDECKKLCLADSNCKYATFQPDFYCYKFSEEVCKLGHKNKRVSTYKKGKHLL